MQWKNKAKIGLLNKIFKLKKFKKYLILKDYKTVYFIGNNYHSFFSLSKGLKKLGWKTFCFNPDMDCLYVHNYDAQGDLSKLIIAFKVFLDIFFHYKVLHIYHNTINAIYRGPIPLLDKILSIPILKKIGVKVLYTPSGCYKGSTSEEINILSPGLCDKCIWQGNLSICDDIRNKYDIYWIEKNVDAFLGEIDLPKKISFSPIGYRLPLSALDTDHYNPFSIIPDEYIINNPANKIIILTAFGNEHIRTNMEKDIKGKKFIINAIKKLIEENYQILHFHATNIPSKYMKYYQIQADLVIDQLNYGTLGSAAREALMLGKPTICHVSKLVRETNIAMKSCPVIDATEKTIYEVLKVCISNKDSLKKVGLASREWAITWYSIESCSQRYEQLIQNILEKRPLL